MAEAQGEDIITKPGSGEQRSVPPHNPLHCDDIDIEAGLCQLHETQNHINLSTPKTTPALDLRPQIGRVPPLNIPSTQCSSSDSIITQDSGFTNGPCGYYGNHSSPLAMAKRRLTGAQVRELIQSQNTAVAQDLFLNENWQQELSGDNDEGDENPYME
ncbi:hypothetical protein BDN67DRAFT_1015159 [Paxillus ammoniavirescens]|nr:hypothetical protein BDN67DRAFT_1015159 [Paxillus ammoniavirescens]